MVMAATVVVSLLAGLAFRRPFWGAGPLFYTAIASLIVPSILVSLGIGLAFQVVGIRPAWYSSGFGAHLTWALPFGLLIMFAVFNRFNPSYEEAARDLGATSWQTFRHVVLPLILPSLIGVGLFGFHAVLRRVRTNDHGVGFVQYASARNLRHDDQRHDAGPLCARHGDDLLFAVRYPACIGRLWLSPLAIRDKKTEQADSPPTKAQMRVLVVNPNTTASMTAKIGAAARAASSAGTEIIAVNPDMGPASIEGYYDEALALPGLLQGDREGRGRPAPTAP